MTTYSLMHWDEQGEIYTKDLPRDTPFMAAKLACDVAHWVDGGTVVLGEIFTQPESDSKYIGTLYVAGSMEGVKIPLPKSYNYDVALDDRCPNCGNEIDCDQELDGDVYKTVWICSSCGYREGD